MIKSGRMRSFVGISFFVLAMFHFAWSEAGEDIPWLIVPSMAAEQNISPRSDSQKFEVYVKRVGSVHFAKDFIVPQNTQTGKHELSKNSFQGQTMAVSFFPGQEFDVTIDSESRPSDDALILHGRLKGHGIATFSLTVTPEGYLLTLQNMDTGIMYRVVGASTSGEGHVQEIDMKLIPPRFDSAPLVPPTQDGQ